MKLIEEKRLREEAKLSEKEEKRLRLDKAKKLKQKWEMTKWIHKYIEENNKKWEKEKRERKEEEEKILKEWERSARFEKIKILHEKLKSKLCIERKEVSTDENR